MDNYEAIAYAVVAITQLQNESKEITPTALRGRMLYLMDKYSETAIYRMYTEEYA